MVPLRRAITSDPPDMVNSIPPKWPLAVREIADIAANETVAIASLSMAMITFPARDG
jgi:hypothetical protein